MALNRVREHPLLTALLAILAVFVLIIILAIAFSESLVRWLAESKGSATLGREIRIDGELNIDWHWTYTAIHAENIRLSNDSDYSEPDMVTLETLDLTFKPLKLLTGTLEFGDITLLKPHIILERKSTDSANWNFPALANDKKENDADTSDGRRNFPIIDTLTVKEGRIIFRDQLKALAVELELDTVIGEGGDDDSNSITDDGFSVEGEGSIQEQSFSLTAAGASLKTLRDSNKEFPLRLTLEMGSTAVEIDGTFQDPIKLAGVNADLKISGNNMADIFYVTAIPLPPTPPYTLQGRLTRKDGIWGYNDFQGEVGGSDLSGNLSYDTTGERGFLQANLISRVLDSKDLGGFIGLPPAAENASPEQKDAAEKKAASPKLIPDVPLRLERLRATDLDVTLKAEKIEAPNLPFKGMDVHFNLKDGLLTLDPLDVKLADGTVDGSIIIDAKQDVPPMSMNLNLRNLSLHQFFANTRFGATTAGFFGGKITLEGTGTSLADVLASSNGDLSIIMVNGKISLLLMEASDLDIAQALPLFLGDDKSTNIRCGVADFNVEDGLLKSEAVVLDTEDALLVGNMSIDMKGEVINAKLDAKPKDNSLLALRIPLVVSGKLKEPAVGLDGKKTAARGAAAVALGTFLSPFAAILPFIEKGDAKDANCRALISKAKEES